MKRNGNHTNIMQDKKTKIKHALHLRGKSKTKATGRKIIIMENKDSPTQG